MSVKSKVKKFSLSLIKASIYFLCIMLISLEAPYVHKSYLRGIAEESTVQIFGKEGSGSGSHVKLASGKVVILTNKHICDMTGPMMVQTTKSKLAIARKIIKVSESHDLCVLEAIPGYKGLSIGDEPTIGDETYTLGHPRGQKLTIANGEFFDEKYIDLAEAVDSEGKCRDGEKQSVATIFGEISFCVIKRSAYQLSNATYPGNSGSPVVNKYGSLIAVIFAGDRNVENQGFAVGHEVVKDFLDSI